MTVRKLHKNVFIGDKFNRLTIVEDAGFVFRPGGKRKQIVKCKCDCGVIRNFAFSQVVCSYSKSCGCLTKELAAKRCSLLGKKSIKYNIGDKFGRLTFLEINEGKKGIGRKAVCICECGNTTVALVNNVVRGHVRSCGCLANESRRSTDGWLSEFNNYKKHCSDGRNINFNLSFEEFKELCQGNCFYCNDFPKINCTVKPLKRNGIDRLNNNLGYILNNCVSCCKICNIMKLKSPYCIFIENINKIYNYQVNNLNLNIPIFLIKRTNIRKATDIWGTEYKRYIKNALCRNYILNLTLDQFKKLCLDNCYYCGRWPTKRTHVGFILRNGIDRINNEQEYNINNSVSCCWPCNKMKGRLNQEYFLKKIKEIYEFKTKGKNA